MPRYDYHCPACEKVRKDVWVSSFRDASKTRAPVICACGQPMTRGKETEDKDE